MIRLDWRLICWLVYASRAAAYDGNFVLSLAVGCEAMGEVGWGCVCDVIAVMIFSTVSLQLSLVSLLAADEILIEELLMSEMSSLSLSMVGWRV